jgi:hypothetical protein
VGGDDRVNHDDREEHEDQSDRDAGHAKVNRTRDQDPYGQGEEQHRWPCDPPAARLCLM